MSKLGAAFWLGLVLVTGFTTFQAKHAVQDIEDELKRVRKHAIAEQQEIRVLAAEWTYLTQPERLADLNRRFLQLAPVATKQLQARIEDLPLRAPAAPPPDIVVAAGAAQPAASQPTAAPATATQPVAAPTPVASRALAVAVATLVAPAHAAAAPRPALQLVNTGTNPLDALIAQIAEGR